MKILALIGIASIAIQPAMAQRDSRTMVRAPIVRTPGAPRPMLHRWGPRENGRWYAGWRAPGGWNAYRRPGAGYIVPRYWLSPTFYIGNWSTYGFAQPSSGLAWSRYYDDAVLIDGNGRVYDTVYGVDWDRYDYGDAYYDDRAGADYAYDDRAPRRDDGVGGALIGAAVGGVAGNVIAGRGERLGGTLIGAGLGAIAGMAIDKSEDRGRTVRGSDFRPYPVPQDQVGYEFDDAGTSYAYNETPGTVVYAPGAPVRQSRWLARSVPRTVAPAPVIVPQTGQGYVANGYYYPAPVTLIIQPGVAAATTVVEEEPVEYVEEEVVEAAPAPAPVRVSRALPKRVVRPAPKKVWRALPKTRTVQRCVC